MIVPVDTASDTRTRLYFGSAVVPIRNSKTSEPSIGLIFQALLGFHKVYSMLLLYSAKLRIKSQQKKYAIWTLLSIQLNQLDFVNRVKELQAFFGATLHILLVNTPYNFKRTKDDKELLEEYAKHYKLENYTLNVYDDYYAEDGIINFTHNIKADMIAMGTHARKGLAHLFIGSVAEEVVNHVDCPIWTYSLKD